MIYTFNKKKFLPISKEQAWDFFSSPYNLQKLTPEYMQFRIVSDLENKAISEAMRLEYRVSPVLGISMKWVSVISQVEPMNQFKDVQIKGPFAYWEHTHLFREVKGGVEMLDELRYALPFGILGRLAHFLWVRKQIQAIFTYRESVLEHLFIEESKK